MSAMTWDRVSQVASALVAERDGEWSGVPMPVKGHRLIIEDKNPWRDSVRQLEESLNGAPPSDDSDGATLINSWYSRSRRGNVLLWREADGRYRAGIAEYDATIRERANWGTIAASQVWSLDAELTAQQKLCTLIPDHLMEMYILIGQFMQTSKRSGVTYIFRRCRPTIAMVPTPSGLNMRILCALCLHPIGYVEDSWAGSMVPTDEVIAHLLLMRGDEPLFWRRANQHPVWSPLAGI